MYAHLFVVAEDVQFSAQVDRINLHPGFLARFSSQDWDLEAFSNAEWGPHLLCSWKWLQKIRKRFL